ncbi:MAG TPA: Do family serine endopeptidase [Abditibacteriaceae bacterium]|jgi:serine protease Do
MSEVLKKNRSGVALVGVASVALAGGYLLRGASVTAQTAAPANPVVQTPATRDAAAIQNAFAQVSDAVEPAVVTITTKRTATPTSGRPRVRPFGGNPFGGPGGPDAPGDNPFGGQNGTDPFEEFFKQFQQKFGVKPNSWQRDDIRARFYQVQEGRGGGGLGSGMIFRSDGYILTNAHVVDDTDKDGVTVKLANGTEYKKARVVGIDERTDVAVIKINATNLPTVKLGDSADVRVGDWAIAVGNPFGLEHTVTVGVISAKAREVPLNERSPGDYLQTDASINPGNSGGPLCDINGRVIGVNNAIYSQSGGNVGIGFAIPMNTARGIAEELIRSGKITRGYLGVEIRSLDEDLATEFGLPRTTKGVLVNTVSPNTPGARAGLQPGDVVQAFNGQAVTKSGELQRLVGAAPVNSRVALRVLRGDQVVTLNATLEELKDDAAATKPAPTTPEPDNDSGVTPGVLGLRLRPMAPGDIKTFNLDAGARGVLVVGVAPNSPAANADLRRGDVIERVGTRLVTTTESVQQAVRQILNGQTEDEKRVALFVNRAGRRSYVSVVSDK